MKHSLTIVLGLCFVVMVGVITAMLVFGSSPEEEPNNRPDPAPQARDDGRPNEPAPQSEPAPVPRDEVPPAPAVEPTAVEGGPSAEPAPDPIPHEPKTASEPEHLYLAQAWDRQFGTTSTERLNTAAFAKDRSILLGGSTMGAVRSASQGGADALVVIFEPDGSLRSTLQFGTAADDEVHAVLAEPTNGRIVVCGMTQGALTGDHNGGKDGFLAAFDENGERRWAQQFGTADDDVALALAIDLNGGVYVCGVLGQAALGGTQAFVTRYTAEGVFKWTQLIDSPGDEQAVSLAIDPQGGVVVGGWTDNALTDAPLGGKDGFIARYAPDGSQRSLHVYGSNRDDTFEHLAVDSNGEVTAAGQTTGEIAQAPGGKRDAIVMRLDAEGQVVWSTQLAGTGDDSVNGLALRGGRAWLSGAFTPTHVAPEGTQAAWLVVLDAQGREAVVHDVPAVSGRVLGERDRVAFISTVPGRAKAYQPTDTDYRLELLAHGDEPIEPGAQAAEPVPWNSQEHGDIQFLASGPDGTLTAMSWSADITVPLKVRFLQLDAEGHILAQHPVSENSLTQHDRKRLLANGSPYADDAYGCVFSLGRGLLDSRYLGLNKIKTDGKAVWENSGPDFGFSGGRSRNVTSDSVGNCVVTHRGIEGANSPDVRRFNRMIKFGPEGHELWRFESPNINEAWDSLQTDDAGRITISSSVYRDSIFTRVGRPTGHFLIRFDAAGNLLWRVPLETDKIGRPVDMVADHRGRTYLLGAFSDPDEHVLARVSEEGKVLWVHPLGIVQRTVGDGLIHEPLDSILKTDGLGNIIVANNHAIGRRFGKDLHTYSTASSIQIFNAHGDIVWEQTTADPGQVITQLAGDPISGITRVLRHETYDEKGGLTSRRDAIEPLPLPERVVNRVLDGQAAQLGAGYNGITLNLQNATRGGRGVSACDILMLHRGEVVQTLAGIRIQKSRGRDSPAMTSVRLQDVPFDTIRIEVKEWIGGGVGLTGIALLDAQGEEQGSRYTLSADRNREGPRATSPADLLRGFSWLGPDNHPSVLTIRRR